MSISKTAIALSLLSLVAAGCTSMAPQNKDASTEVSVKRGIASGDNYCHAMPEDAAFPHPNILPQIDFQMTFNGSDFAATSLWINVKRGSISLPNKVFARLINHGYNGDEQAIPVTLTLVDNGTRLTGQIPSNVHTGGMGPDGRGIDQRIWQTLSISYNSPGGPSETRNFNFAKTYNQSGFSCMQVNGH